MRVPLAAPDLTGNELRYVTECIETGFITHIGRFQAAFEAAFARRFDTRCIATSSGTGALHIALLSLGIGPGDEVVLPALTFGAAAAVVLAVGARPVLVDIEVESWGFDRRRLAEAITRRTRAIIPVHLYGEDAGDYREFGVPVVEDACEALGMVPMRGRLTAISFFGNKCLTTGEGGMLCGDLGNAKVWRDGGFDATYRYLLPGLNYRMTNLQAALGLAQLEHFDPMLEARLANARAYREALPGRGQWLFCVRTENIRALRLLLENAGVDSRPIFPPLHLSPAFRQYAGGAYPAAERVWETHLSLPTGPHVKPEQRNAIIALVSAFLQSAPRRGRVQAA
jgi:perosamine synthetase